MKGKRIGLTIPFHPLTFCIIALKGIECSNNKEFKGGNGHDNN